MKKAFKTIRDRKITVIGGTGFVGTQITQALAQAGYRVHVVARDAEAGAHLTCFGATGQVIVTSGDVRKPESLRSAIKGAYGVIYLPGVLYQSGKQKFQTIHATAPETIAQMSKELKVPRFIFMSALGVNYAKSSSYASSKHEGEARVTAARSDATILRPSVIFGAADNFLNQFGRLATLFSALPLINGGKTRFQPVFVGDVAEAVVRILQRPRYKGKTFELGGADILTFKEILQLICGFLHRTPCLLPIPYPIAKIMGFFMGLLPTPPLTSDQVSLLQYDSVVSEKSLGLSSLDITPHSIYIEAPFILRRYIRQQPTEQ